MAWLENLCFKKSFFFVTKFDTFRLDKMLLIQHRSENATYYMESKSTTKYSEQYMKLCEISPIEDETEMLPIQFLIILWS